MHAKLSLNLGVSIDVIFAFASDSDADLRLDRGVLFAPCVPSLSLSITVGGLLYGRELLELDSERVLHLVFCVLVTLDDKVIIILVSP